LIVKTYNVESEAKALVSEETYNEKDQLSHRIDYHQGEPFLVSTFEYDQDGRTIGQTEKMGDEDEILSLYEYVNDDLARTTRSVKGDIVFEEIIISENGVTDIVQKEDNVLSEHIVKTADNNKGFMRQFFDPEDNELERHIYKWPSDIVSELHILDGKSELLALEVCLHDSDGQVIRKSIQNNENAIVLLEIASYFPHGEPKTVLSFDSTKDVQWTTTTFEYNEQNQFIESEVADDAGNILEFVKRAYGPAGEIIQEIYFKPFTKGTIARQIGDGEAYHLIVERNV
jgi:hypothetical protein